MSALLLALCVFVILGLSMAAGMWIRGKLPAHHLSEDSKEVMQLATAVVGTLSALALGLLIASAKSDYDDAERELKATAANIVLLDRVMAQYGPETRDTRLLLRKLIQDRLDRGWSIQTSDQTGAGVPPEYRDIETVQLGLRSLVPQDQARKFVQTRALDVAGKIAEGHWLQVETEDEGLPWGFFIVLVFWLALLFGTFGLQAPPNATVMIINTICALSVAGAIFATSDMDNPYAGFIRISDEPLQGVLARLGQP
jgi:hypothetical protein